MKSIETASRIFFFLFLATPFLTIAQDNSSLLHDTAFFSNSQNEFDVWLEQNNLAAYIVTTDLKMAADKITLFLEAGHEIGDCDDFRDTWINLCDVQMRNQPRGQTFSEVLMTTWSFFTAVEVDSIEIVLRCQEDKKLVAIYGTTNGRIITEEFFDKEMSTGVETIPVSKLKRIYSGNTFKAGSGKNTAKLVREEVGRYIREWYSTKGTDVLFNAKLKIDESYFSEFTYIITHLENEIIQEDFFEYHRINIKVVQMGGDININWDFRGKFGHGIFTTPRDSEYKPIENYYPGKVADYEKKLLRHITDHLINH